MGTAMSSAEEMCGASDVIYTQTPGSTTCVEKSWLKPHATIICSGSDQPTKQEIPTDILKASKYVSDLTKQTSKVGELRSAIADGSMRGRRLRRDRRGLQRLEAGPRGRRAHRRRPDGHWRAGRRDRPGRVGEDGLGASDLIF